MTPTEKLLAHLQNILPRRDWELHGDAIARMVAQVWLEGHTGGHVEANEKIQFLEKPQ